MPLKDINPTLIDVRITPNTRDVVAQLFTELDVTRGELNGLAQTLGVQPRTLEGWIEGRGSPVPKSAIGRFAYSELPYEWGNRVMVAQLLGGEIEQAVGYAERTAFYDDMTDTLDVIIDRAAQFVSGNIDDDWVRDGWRTIRIERSGSLWTLVVEYSREMS